MIVIMTDRDLHDYGFSHNGDWVILLTAGHLLEKKKEHQVVRHTELDFKNLGHDEPLYLLEHGAPGGLVGAPVFSVPVKHEGMDGISHIIGKALDDAKTAGGYKCPKEFFLYICSSGLDYGGGNAMHKQDLKPYKKPPGSEFLMPPMASMVRGVTMALAKRGLLETRVTGYRGSAMVRLSDGHVFARKDAQEIETPKALNVDAKYGPMREQNPFKAVLEKKCGFIEKAKALYAVPWLHQANAEYMAAIIAEGGMYKEDEGKVVEVGKDALPYIKEGHGVAAGALPKK